MTSKRRGHSVVSNSAFVGQITRLRYSRNLRKPRPRAARDQRALEAKPLAVDLNRVCAGESPLAEKDVDTSRAQDDPLKRDG